MFILQKFNKGISFLRLSPYPCRRKANKIISLIIAHYLSK